MKYRLKDRVLQWKLESIGGKNNVRKAIDEHLEKDGGVMFAFDVSDKCRITIGITKDELELDQEYGPHAYDPHDWNKFPDVKPPEGVWMRTEYVSRTTGETTKTAARYEEFEGNFYWFDELDFETEVDRFRPWED